MTKQKKEVSLAPSSETLAALRNEFPQEQNAQHISLPRLSLVSQDVTEEVKAGGKKQINIITEAGTFVEESKSEDEIDPESGKAVWVKTELGTEIEGIIVFQRRQLRFYDSANEMYTSSNVYDDKDEEVILFSGGKQVAKGFVKDLQAQYPQGKTLTGRPKPLLEESKVLYVLFNDQPYQMTIRGSSMYAYLDYARTVTPPEVVTQFSSEAKENGSIKWNQMTFKAVRHLNAGEAGKVLTIMRDTKAVIAAEKSQYAERSTQEVITAEQVEKEAF